MLERFGFRRGQVPLCVDWTPLRPEERSRPWWRQSPAEGEGFPLRPGRSAPSRGLISGRIGPAGLIHLVLVWERGQKEPWYLATDLVHPQKAIRFYRRRAWIDEMFRDWKQHFRLEGSRVASVERLEGCWRW